MHTQIYLPKIASIIPYVFIHKEISEITLIKHKSEFAVTVLIC